MISFLRSKEQVLCIRVSGRTEFHVDMEKITIRMVECMKEVFLTEFLMNTVDLSCQMVTAIKVNQHSNEGQIRLGRATGHGFYETDYWSYKGEFKDNVPHGEGEEKGENSYFKGEYEYGEKRDGILKHGDNVYEGQFMDGLYHGKGELTTSEGLYIGDFREGKQHGYGEFKWNNQSIYRGFYNMGRREGQGQYFNARNKSISRGFWKNGKLSGEGLYIEPQGQQYKCIWKDGKITALLS